MALKAGKLILSVLERMCTVLLQKMWVWEEEGRTYGLARAPDASHHHHLLALLVVKVRCVCRR